jgi:hypothetical protein
MSSGSQLVRKSRLRTIIIDGCERGRETMLESVYKVMQLCNDNHTVRKEMYRCVGLRDPPPASSYHVPKLFTNMATAAYSSGNSFYQQAIILFFMLFDPGVFGRFMLQHEPPTVQEAFMKALKNATSNFLFGRRMDGTIFDKTDSIMDRKTGAFVIYMQSCFAML